MEKIWAALLAKVRRFWTPIFDAVRTTVFVYCRNKRIESVMQALETLKITNSKIEVLNAIRVLQRAKVIDLEMEKTVEDSLTLAFERLGMDVIFQLCKCTTKRNSELYDLFNRLIKKLFKNNIASIKAFITQSRTLVDESPECLLSIFHAIKSLVYSLLDSGLQNHAAEALGQMIKMGFFGLVTNSCIKVACTLLEIVVRYCVMPTDNGSTAENKLALEDFVGAINCMLVKPPEVFFNKVLDMFAKSKQHAASSELILEVMISNKIRASLVTFNTLLEVYIGQRNYKMAWYLFDSLVKNADPKPDSYTYCTMMSGLRSCNPVNVQQIEMIFNMHAEAGQPDLVVVNCLLDVYMITDNDDKATEFLTHLKETYGLLPDVATYNTLIKGSARRKAFAQAETYLKSMRDAGLKPNAVTFNSLMDICVKSKKLTKALGYLREMTSNGCQPDHFSYSIIFTGMKACASQAIYQQCVSHLLTLLPSPSFKVDEVFFNAIMDVACRFKDTENVEAMLGHMRSRGIAPSTVTFGVLVKTFGRAKMLSKVKEAIHEMVHERRLVPNDVFYGTLIEAYINCDSVVDAEATFNDLLIRKVKVNEVILATMVKGYTRERRFDAAIGLFEEYREKEDFVLNTVCFNSALDAAVKSRNLKLARSYFDEMYDRNISPDLITYSIIIKGHCSDRDAFESVNLIKQMISEGVVPDLPIFNNVLETCANFKDFEKGIYVYRQLLSQQLVPNVITYGIMVKIYGFSKEVHKAFDLLGLMAQQSIQPSLIFFTNLIHISIANRKPQMAMQALDLLEKHGIVPDQFCADKLLTGLAKSGKNEVIVSHARQRLAVHGLKVGLATGDHKQRQPPMIDRCDTENINLANTSTGKFFIPVEIAPKAYAETKPSLSKCAEPTDKQATATQAGPRVRQFGMDCQNIIKKAKPTVSNTVKSMAIR